MIGDKNQRRVNIFHKAKVVTSLGSDYGFSCSVAEMKIFSQAYKSTNLAEYRPVVAAGLFLGQLCATEGDFDIADRMFGEHLEKKVSDMLKFLKITEEEGELILCNKRDCSAAAGIALNTFWSN